MRNVLKSFPVFVALFCLSAFNANAQQYSNGGLSTGATTLSGVSAPVGTTWSEVQNNTGNTSESNTVAGFSTNAGTFRLADNFTVPAGPSWSVSKISTYAYLTGAGTTSPFTALFIQIWNGRPGDPGSAVIFGDVTTNRLSASVDAGMFRAFNTIAPPPGTAPGTTRRIWRNEANISGLTLAPGTYWVEWATVVNNNPATAHFAPSKTIVGSRGAAGDNARQLTVASSTWANIIDDGNPASAPDFPQDFPFLIDYTTGACTGTPAPGNTIRSVNTVCPSTPFTLSLQNLTPGSGVTYQWQSGPSATGPWTSISGATNSTYNAPSLTATTFFQCIVTCGANSGTSTPQSVALNPPSACYCIPPAMDCTDDDEIIRVRISTLDNASTCGAGPPPGYSNFTSLTAPTVFSGAPNPITVNFQTLFSKGCAVWIDYNQNGIFETTEFTSIGTGVGTVGSLTADINIPATALNGVTRMRVRTRFGATAWLPTAACTNPSGFGETEDYNVNIQPCVPVAITGSPSNATIACGGNTTFTVTTSGSLPSFIWQWRPNATTAWQNVPNAAPFSGVNTATLTLINMPQTFNGAQFRAQVTGACSATDVSAFATLTVNSIAPVISPTSSTICTGSIQQLSLTNTLGNVDVLTEGFNTVSPLPAGWAAQNLSSPLGVTGWSQGVTTVFPANSGPATSYISANFNNTTGVGTISNWLFLPNITIKNGDQLKFFTRIPAGTVFPDRLQVRLSTNGASTNVGASATSVGDFTTLLLDINPTYTSTGYPQVWTQFTATVTGVAVPTSGRLAFRYFVENGGPSGANSNFIGIDDVVYTITGGAAQGTWTNIANPTSNTNMWATSAGSAGAAYVLGTPATSIWVTPTATSTYGVTFNTLTPCASAVGNVTVNVTQPVTITTQPASVAACRGANAVFSVVAGGAPITYQWQESRDNGLTWTNIANTGIYSGATTATLTLTGVTDATSPVNMNGFRYRVNMVAAPCNTTATPVQSNGAATLTVNPLPAVNALTATDLLLTPGNPTGNRTTITASSTPAAASYIWTYNGAALTTGTPAVPVTSATYSTGIDGLGTYNVRAITAAGCTSTVAQSASITIGAEASDRLWIYPNPTTGAFQVRYYYTRGASFVEGRQVKIYNAIGELVASKTFSITASTPQYMRMDFDLSNMANGTYVVKLIEQNKGVVVSGLVVVQ